MHVIGIRDVILIRHMRDDPKPALQALGKLIGRALHRRAIQGETNIRFSSPCGALVI